MRKAWTIKDARGNAIELWHGGGPESMLNELSLTERRRFADIVWPDNFRFNLRAIFKITLYLAGVAAVGALLGFLFAVLRPRDLPNFIVGALVAMPVAAMTTVLLRCRLRKLQQSTEYTEAVLEIKRCPACLYQLEGQQLEPDGCIVCPECGGAWRHSAP